MNVKTQLQSPLTWTPSCGINLNVDAAMLKEEIKTYFTNDSKLNLYFGDVPTGEVQLELIDLTGAAVLRQNLGVVTSNEDHIIELYDVKSGIYLLRLISEDYEVVNKLLK